MPDSEYYLSFPILPEESGKRLDSVLKHRGLSMSVIRRAKRRTRGLLLNGKEVYTSYPVAPGQTASILVGDREPSTIPPSHHPIPILYEDTDLLVINKPATLAVHPCAGSWDDSVGARLTSYYQKTNQTANFHPVHRLDKCTSGLMVIAKHPAAQHALTLQLHTDHFLREYLAICEGAPTPSKGIIDHPLGHCEDSYIRQCVRADGKPARTRYEVLERGRDFCLVRLTLETGRTHQIRVHMAFLGHPLAGDFLYGRELPEWIARPALHSSKLSLTQPFTGQRLTFEAALPKDMSNLRRAFLTEG